ncbi:MAG: hypothetical protein HY855_01705 [Burkholderiales bacterium]|nr:hypothetical protein [Burkholderiales bacterium]
MPLPSMLQRLPRWALLLPWLACLCMAPAALHAAECGQITTWQASDFAAALYPSVITVNSPGAPPGGPPGGGLATTIAATPQPSGARTLANNTAITVYSFTSAANASAYYAHRRAHIVLPPVHEQAGQVAIVSSTLRQGSVTDLYLDALHRSSVILVAGYADSSQPMASGSAVSLYLSLLAQAQALVDAKCGPVTPVNRPPTIALSPDPAAAPAFQELMTQGHEFALQVNDPDGIGDIDLGSFHVWVAGVDKTRHFLETVARHPSRQRQVSTATGATYYLRPDPQFLMTEFNYFNIQWNGKWPVAFGICDRQGACARADYTIYFGPYFALTPATWLGQAGGGCVGTNKEIRVSYILGNNGHDSQHVGIYLGLLRASDDALWTYGRDDSPNQWHWKALVPAWNWPNALSGVRISPPGEVALTLDTKPAYRPIAAGSYELLATAAEPSATDMLLVSRPAVICAH